MLNLIERQGHTFVHIMLYNAIRRTGEAHDAIEQTRHIHSVLLGRHAFMAGFQFLGISGWQPSSVNQTLVATTQLLLALGFVTSVVASTISFTALEFYIGMKNEPSELIVGVTLRWWPFFYASDQLLFVSLILFTSAVNLMLHTTRISSGLCWAINAVSLVAFGVLVVGFKRIVLGKQRSDDVDGDGKPVTRHIYAHDDRALEA